MGDPNEALAAEVVAQLVEAGLVLAEDGGAVVQALATGKASPDDWRRWTERGREGKGA